MSEMRQPFASFSDGTLRIVFRDPGQIASVRSLDAIVELDELGDPLGIEIIGLEAQLGRGSSEALAEITVGSDIRLSYDSEVDAAVVGIAIATGFRRAESVPKRGTASLDSSSRLVSIEIADLQRGS